MRLLSGNGWSVTKRPIPVRTAATPLMLAVIASKIRCRSRERSANAPTANALKTAPARTETTITVPVPRFRRLTTPVSPPT